MTAAAGRRRSSDAQTFPLPLVHPAGRVGRAGGDRVSLAVHAVDEFVRLEDRLKGSIRRAGQLC